MLSSATSEVEILVKMLNHLCQIVRFAVLLLFLALGWSLVSRRAH